MSILVILRDRGLPLPAGAILVSPWVDLTHSFPSVGGDASHDYIPAHGFLQRPSAAWPPPNADEIAGVGRSGLRDSLDKALARRSSRNIGAHAQDDAKRDSLDGFAPGNIKTKKNLDNGIKTDGAGNRPRNISPGAGHKFSIMFDGKLIKIEDQIHMYTTNSLISHPLVSPVLQPSLGGLPPLLVLTGGGEVLRDEQIYLAHKAANPTNYPSSDAYLDKDPDTREVMSKWKPTDVQLQVWDDLCHVAPTLSFTRPAKFMYRSIAQFGAWALARAQHTAVEIQDDDDVSVISSASESEVEKDVEEETETKAIMRDNTTHGAKPAHDKVGRAGQPLPPFKNHMIRQRVDRHGNIYALEPPAALPALQVPPDEIGVIKPGPVQKWLNAKQQWDSMYARDKRRVQKQRAKEISKRFQGFGENEVPPPSALAGRRGLDMPKEEKRGKSWGMSLWSLWGSSHDEHTIEREKKVDKEVEAATVTENNNAHASSAHSSKARNKSISKSQRRTVTYPNQDKEFVENTSSAAIEPKQAQLQQQNGQASTGTPHPAAPTMTTEEPAPGDTTLLPPPSDPYRPSAGGRAFPFKLGSHLREDGRNASTITLTSMGVITPKGDEKGKQLGITKIDDGDTNNGNGDVEFDRRVTMEDKDGVLHKQLAEREIAKPNDTLISQDGVATPEPSEKEKQFGETKDTDDENNNGDGDGGFDRRVTMEDKDGVLHKRLVEREVARPSAEEKEKKKKEGASGAGKGMERPGVERFETAREENVGL